MFGCSVGRHAYGLGEVSQHSLTSLLCVMIIHMEKLSYMLVVACKSQYGHHIAI